MKVGGAGEGDVAVQEAADLATQATTGLCAFGVLRTKVLREKVHCRSLSSIHMDYNQPLVGGLSVHSTPARQIAKFQLPGGSKLFRQHCSLPC